LRRVAAPAPKPFAVSRPSVETETEVETEVTRDAEEPRVPEPRVIEGEESRVHYEPVRSAERVPETRVELAYEFEKNRYVPLAKEALAQLAAPTSTDIELSEFVKLEQIDPVYFETSYFVIPGPGGERPYALLYRALRDAGRVGMASIAMHRREHTVVLRPDARGLLLHTMFYADEVRTEQQYAAQADVNPKELKMAATLIDALSGDFDSGKYRDPYREKMQALIDTRVAAADKTRPAERPATAPPDVMEALRASLDSLRKPAAGESRARAASKIKRSSRKAG
jgi:DNA end-binding protein Ku